MYIRGFISPNSFKNYNDGLILNYEQISEIVTSSIICIFEK